MKLFVISILVGLLLAILVFIVLPQFQVRGGPEDLHHQTLSNGVTYELFYVEGMPCMRFGRAAGDTVWNYDGVSCDWSKWNGQLK